MHDLDSRLRTYFDDIAPPVLEETVRRRAAHRASQRPRLGGPLLAVVVAAALFVVVGGVVVVGLLFGGPGRTTITQPAPTTVPTTIPTTLPPTSAPTPTTAATGAASDALGLSTSAVGSPMGWTRLGYDSAVFGDAQMERIVATPTGFLVVGTDIEGSAMVWTSPDGLNWTRMAHVDFQLPEGSEAWRVDELVYVDGRFVLLGQSKRFMQYYPYAWVSTDGLTWVSHAMPLIRNAEIMALVTGGVGDGRTPQLLAASVGGDPPQALHIFSSVDGESWDVSYIDPDPLPAYPTINGTRLAFVNGTFIALNSLDPSERLRTAVWTADQTSAPTEWSRTILDRGCDFLEVAGDKVFTLCGDSVGVTSDGTGWQFGTLPELPADTGGIGFLLGDANGSVLIAGSLDYSDPRKSVWTTDDGVTWALLPSDAGAVFDGAFATDFTSHNGTSVAVGSACSAEGDVCAGVVWVQLP